MTHPHVPSAFIALALVAGPAAAGDVTGRVLLEGRPAAEVVVAVLPFEDGLDRSLREARDEPEPEPLVEGTTVRDGSFRLRLPAAGPEAPPVRLRVSGDEMPPRILELLVDAVGGDVGDVRLAPSTALAGRVVDGRGGPVVGATVRLWAGRGGRFAADLADARAVPQVATTGADGAFRFEAAADTGNRIRVSAPGLATVERTGLRGGAVAQPVTLDVGRLLRGTAWLPDGRTPARGALVRFAGRSTTRWHEVRSDGSFLIEGVPARETGEILAEGGDRGRAVVPVGADGDGPMRIVLARNAALDGRVVAADTGRPLSGVRVVATAGDGSTFLARSDRRGRYTFAGLPPRSYQVEVDDERFVPWSRTVEVSPGRGEVQDIPVVLGATLRGRVTSEEGQPIGDATVQVSRDRDDRMQSFVLRMQRWGEVVTTGPDGRFEARRLPPGEGQRLDVRHVDYEDRSVGGIDLRPGATTSGVGVVLRAGLALEGRVRDGDGRPVPGVRVELQQPRTFRSRRGGSMSVTMMGPPPERESAADGRFAFRGLVAGDYTLVASRQGYARVTVDPVRLADEEVLEPLELVMAPGVTISGFVRDGSGEGAPGWFVAAQPPDAGSGIPFGPAGIRMDQPTGPDGAFLLEGLVEGEAYDLQVMGSSGLGPRQDGVVAPADELEITVPGLGQIRGRATDAESGQALTDFEVSFRPDGRGGMRFFFGGDPAGRGPYRPRTVHADDGAFVLDDVPPGRWTVEVTVEGYQPGTASGIAVEEGQTVEGVDIVVSRGLTIVGRVVEADSGRPILEAAVRAQLSGGARQRPRIMGGGGDQALTDADGHYEITGLAPGSWALTASHPDWSEDTVTVELEDAPVTADLRLSTGGTIRGTVLAGGRPVAGADVGLSESGEARFRGFGGQGKLTGEDGRFRFEQLSPGRYTLSASLRSQSSDPVEAVVTGTASQDVTLILEEGAALRGTVSGLPQAALSNVSVTASGPDRFFASTRAGSDGTFELTGVPEGTISLRASTGTFLGSTRTASATVTVGPGQMDAYAEVVFEPGLRVEGRVSRSGEPVSDAYVNALPEGGGGGRFASARTDEMGAYAMEGLEEGTYDLVVAAQNGAPVRKSVTLTGDTTVDIEIPPAWIAGTVLEAGTGQPLGDVRVYIEEDGSGIRLGNMASSDSAGRFALEDLEPRAYRLTFQKPAYETETMEVTAGDGREIQVEMRRGEGLSLVARDGMFGTPLRGLMVRLVDASGLAVFSGTVPLDSQGRGEVPSVKPGSYELRAMSSGYAPLVRPGVMVPSSSVALALTPGGTLEIHVGPETLALPQVQARLYGADGRPYLTSMFSVDGVIHLGGPVRRLEHVAAGSYVLAVEGGARQHVQVREGALAVVTLP